VHLPQVHQIVEPYVQQPHEDLGLAVFVLNQVVNCGVGDRVLEFASWNVCVPEHRGG